MTVIVGIPHKGVVYFGADSQATNAWSGWRMEISEPKIWAQDGVTFGLTGSGREAQIIEHHMARLPRKDDIDPMRWLVVDFTDALRQARKASGYDEKLSTGVEAGPSLLIGLAGRLFAMSWDYHVHERPGGEAIGSGGDAARGSLHTSAAIWKTPDRRIEAALKAACYSNAFCCPPFVYRNTAE